MRDIYMRSRPLSDSCYAPQGAMTSTTSTDGWRTPPGTQSTLSLRVIAPSRDVSLRRSSRNLVHPVGEIPYSGRGSAVHAGESHAYNHVKRDGCLVQSMRSTQRSQRTHLAPARCSPDVVTFDG